jgi:hypothetical protein
MTQVSGFYEDLPECPAQKGGVLYLSIADLFEDPFEQTATDLAKVCDYTGGPHLRSGQGFCHRLQDSFGAS